jgi:hypothetical protein
MHFPLLPVEAALSSFNFSFFVKKNREGINGKKGDCLQCQIISFLKMFIMKRLV